MLEPRHTATDNLEHQILAGGTTGISIAAAFTVVRLALRIRTLGWDDAFAFLGLISLILTGVTGKLYYSLKASSVLDGTNVIYTTYTASLLLFATLILVAQIFWVCEPQDHRTHWKSKVIPQCVLGQSVAIVQVTTDALADAVLITVPIIIMHSLKSSRSMAMLIRLSVSFAVGGLTTIVSIIHAFYLWQDTEISIIVSNAELAVSLIICNFVVLAAAIHRLWSKFYPQPVVENQEKSTVQMMFASRPTHSHGEATRPDTLVDLSQSKTFVGHESESTETAQLCTV